MLFSSWLPKQQRSDVGSAAGGGIWNNPDGSLLIIQDSTICGNIVRGGSTITGNGSAAVGGGISNQSGILMMTHSIVEDNQAIGGNGGSGFKGGLADGGGLQIAIHPGDPPGGPASASVIDSVFSGNQAIGG